ncbi:MAG: ComF family protein [Verrucomicrobiae bacterium]|nr:ComF family protein [Verrucomicrobiae bacterium]
MLGAAEKWTKATLELFYPRNCQACTRPLAETEPGVICSQCLETVRRIERPCCARCSLPFYGAINDEIECGYCKELKFHFSRAVAACLARGVVRLAIHEFKYNGKWYFAPHLAEWIIAAAMSRMDCAAVDVVVPVPLHPRKHRERGFNQAEFLAKQVGKATGKPVWTRCIRRLRDTQTQTHLDREQRMANLRDAFEVPEPTPVKGRVFVLVDDVFTTGATLDACAKVLRKAGAADVWVLTVARAAYL